MHSRMLGMQREHRQPLLLLQPSNKLRHRQTLRESMFKQTSLFSSSQSILRMEQGRRPPLRRSTSLLPHPAARPLSQLTLHDL